MIISNKVFNDKSSYNYNTDIITSIFLSLLIISAALFMLEINIIAVIVIILGVIVCIITLCMVTKKAKRTKNLNDIKTVKIENNNIEFCFENETCLKYKYDDIKNVDIIIETTIRTGVISLSWGQTVIRNTAVSILFSDGNLWKFDFFNDVSKKSIDTIRYILNELKDYNINIKYQGRGDNSKLKHEISL